MGTVTTLPQRQPIVLPRSRPLTGADLDSLPDDGHRYELIDGTLVVSPAPSTRHQRILARLHLALAQHCPPELEVFFAPLDVVLADDTVLQPDLLVARRSDLTEDNLPAPPMLAVEVLSPSTRRVDLTLKRSRLEEAGCPSYWVVDPDEPCIIAWELRDGGYVETAHVAGDETFTTDQPYPVTFSPHDLVG
ncbi:MAG: Uma2 family endonuclease [Nocardioidaceae bacterium]